MKFGMVADVTESTLGIVELAKAVEQAGLESLFLTQHTHVPTSRADVMQQPDHHTDARLLDPFVALGAAASVTARLKLGTGACLPALYDAIILAKQVATLDHISAGRFLFGVAPGWLEEEMRNHNVDPALRWRILRERVLAMKAIWTQEEAEFHGQFVGFDPIYLWPKPIQQPHPPVLIAGRAPRALQRVVEYGDGWMPVVTPSTDLETHILHLDRLSSEAGRNAPPVTAVIWDIDEALIQNCATLGVWRCALFAIPERETFRPLLHRWRKLTETYGSGDA